MAASPRETLAGIKRFDQLVAYLRDELGWPIERDNFEDLFFDYTPDELGIEAKSAAKIQEIKRLRPLSANQPFGVFYVKFEPRRLPVVALRRILSSVTLKKRASANAADRAAWQVDDLLFLSSYGEGEDRQIGFAHFSAPQGGNDLPTLKVLGWDNQDTPLHLDRVAKELDEHLSWPAKEGDRGAWREQWRGAFTLRHGEVIRTSKELSIKLAGLARAIHDRIVTALAVETERGPLTKLMNAFREALVHDLTPESFADMYAQTITYGLLSARIADPTKKTADDFAAHMRTSPFLRELMEHFLRVGGRRGKAGGPGIDFDELGVSDVVELLDSANMEAVVADFGDKNRQEDPVIHFYEHFLAAYNKKLKVQRGVFYTPQPVVSYIVRSVHELLQTEFGLGDGLADTTTWGEMVARHPGLKLPPLTDEPGEERTISPDEPFVQILDPATGTATFLVEVIDVIKRTLSVKWAQQSLTQSQQLVAWNDYVPRHLLPRLHAYELMMAPYAIAHMKVGLKLTETGYQFESQERARIYLTNALEPWQKQLKVPDLDALAHEAGAVNEVKRHKRFTVVVGNPPYAGISSNKSEPAQRLVDAYRTVDGAALIERKVWLQDDYVKFIRMAQIILDSSGLGVLGYITNHGYIDNPTFRGMRQSLLATFPTLRVLDLHGNANKREQSPDGSSDINVFDIRQGVAVCLATRGRGSALVGHFDVWGPRQAKSDWFSSHSVGDTAFAAFSPRSPFYFFKPQSLHRREEYESGFKLTDAMPCFGLGFQSSRDHLVVGFDSAELVSRISRFISALRSDTEVRNELFPDKEVADYLPGDTRQWSLHNARRQLRADAGWEELIRSCLYRPFDWRVVLYDNRMVDWPRPEVLGHMLHPNLCLLANRQSKEEFAVLCSDSISERKIAAVYDASSSFPLYLYQDEDKLGLTAAPRLNFSTAFLKALAAGLGLPQRMPHGLPAKITPEDIFHYTYAVFHSPCYRSRYSEFLRIDFPRLPLTGRRELFGALARIGAELRTLHLLESPELSPSIRAFIGRRPPEIEKISWSKNTVWIDKMQSTGFPEVSEDVWNFHIGGYRVCEKWLKDRKGRRLSKEDIEHYQKIVVAISETLRIMKEIDEVIEAHGGWPGAFQTGGAKVAVAAAGPALPFRPRTVEPAVEERYVRCVPLVPLRIAAGGFGEAQPALDEGTEWVEVSSRHRLRPGMFVSQVSGRSMEPMIPDGAWCLFAAPVTGSRQERVVLAQLRDATDPETGERYTIKRYESRKSASDEGWRHEAITLKPDNPEFPPIELEAGDEERLAVVAEFLEVLTDTGSGQPAEAAATEGDEPQPQPKKGAAWSKRPAQRSLLEESGEQLDLGESAGEMAGAADSGSEGAERPRADELDRDELVCGLRALFGDGASRSRDGAIRELARELGFERTGSRIREAIDIAIRTAVRRGVLTNEGDQLALHARSIEQYDRDFLKEQFLAALGGAAWTERDEAARALARWLGFRRTGPAIAESVKSLIHGLLREGRLQADGFRIRRSR